MNIFIIRISTQVYDSFIRNEINTNFNVNKKNEIYKNGGLLAQEIGDGEL